MQEKKTQGKLDAPYVPRIAYDTKSRFFLSGRAVSEGRWTGFAYIRLFL